MGYINLKKILFIFILLATPGMLSAQTLNLQTIPSDKKQFGFIFNKAFFSNNTNMSTLSGVYQLYVNIPVSSKLNIIGNIPYINTSYDIDYGFGRFSFSEHGFGNIFIGMQTRPNIMENQRSIFTFGLFLPTAAEQASANGLLADYYYFSKYIPNSIGVYFNYAYHHISAEGFNYGLELGPNLLIGTKSNSETELFAHYGASFGYQINKLLLNMEVIGIAIISEDVDNFGDRFVNMINIGAQWRETTVTPKIFYEIYLRDEIRHNVDGVLGIGVNVSID
jgi:hypothetical protein